MAKASRGSWEREDDVLHEHDPPPSTCGLSYFPSIQVSKLNQKEKITLKRDEIIYELCHVYISTRKLIRVITAHLHNDTLFATTHTHRCESQHIFTPKGVRSERGFACERERSFIPGRPHNWV